MGGLVVLVVRALLLAVCFRLLRGETMPMGSAALALRRSMIINCLPPADHLPSQASIEWVYFND